MLQCHAWGTVARLSSAVNGNRASVDEMQGTLRPLTPDSAQVVRDAAEKGAEQREEREDRDRGERGEREDRDREERGEREDRDREERGETGKIPPRVRRRRRRRQRVS